MQLFCLPSLMLRSLHLIQVESIIAKKKKKLTQDREATGNDLANVRWHGKW